MASMINCWSAALTALPLGTVMPPEAVVGAAAAAVLVGGGGSGVLVGGGAVAVGTAVGVAFSGPQAANRPTSTNNRIGKDNNFVFKQLPSLTNLNSDVPNRGVTLLVTAPACLNG